MVTNYQAVKGIQDIIVNKTGRTHNASRWSERLLYFHLNNYRIKLVWELRISKNKPVSDFMIETIPCMPLIDVKEHECICEVEGKCIKKGKYPLPETLTGKLEFVSDLGGKKYDYIQFENLGKPSKSIFKGRREKSFYSLKTIDGLTYPYILDDPHKEFVSIKLIPKDPLDLFKIPDCNGKVNTCFDPLVEEFKVEGEMLSMIYQLFAKEILNISLSTGLDLDLDFQDGTGLNQRISKK